MKWDKYQGLFGLFIVCTLTLASVYILVYSWPKYEERFIAMGILGRNGKAEDYYPKNDSSIQVGDQVYWYIYVYNHWDKVQNVSIMVKILNSTTPPPNDLKDESSPASPILEIRLLLNENETRLVPFFWHVEDAEIRKNVTVINKLVINEKTISLNVYGKPDSFFRIIFELWIFNEETGSFEYGWHSKEIHYCVWNGMRFDVTSPA